MAKSKKNTNQEKKEKIPASVQKYIPLVQSQVQYAQKANAAQNSDADNIAKLQQEYNDWKNVQDLQKEYDSWKAKKTTSNTASTASEPVKYMTAEERKAYNKKTTIEKPGKYDESKSYANTYGKQAVTKGIKQLPTLEDYRKNFKKQDSGIDKEIANYEKREAIVDKAKAYLDPNKKFTKADQKEAKKIAKEGLNTLKGRSPSKMLSYEKEAYDTFKDLQAKSSTIASVAIGAADKALDYGKAILQGVADTQARKLSAENKAKNALGINTGLSTQELRDIDTSTKANINRFNEKIVPTVQQAKNAAPIASPTIPFLNKKVDINPYDVGRMATMVGAYAATNPAFDALGEAANMGRVGKFALNQAGQLGQDLALDTSIEVDKALSDGLISSDEAQAIKNNIALNAAFNGVLGVGGEAAKSIGDIVAKRQVAKAANEAFRANALTGLDRLQQVNNGVQFGYHNTNPEAVFRNADDITAATNNQFADLMSEYNRTVRDTFKDDSAMRNIYSPEDLDTALNRQLTEALQNNPRVEIPEVQAPKIPETENAIPEITQNVPKTELKPQKTKVELSEEVADQIGSDLMEMQDALDLMRRAAETTNNEAALAKFSKLSATIDDYEKALYYAEDLTEVNKAKKAADAARQSFIREMKKINPNYKGELTGTKIGNAEYRRTSQQIAQEEADELANSFIESEKELGGNNYVQDAQPDNVDIFRGPNAEPLPTIEELRENVAKVKAQSDAIINDVAKTQQIDANTLKIRESPTGKGTRYQIVSEKGNLSIPLERKRYKSKEAAESALENIKKNGGVNNYRLQFFADNAPKERWETSKFRTNTAENIGKIKNPDDVPIKQYGYRVYSEAEQHATAAANNLSADDLIYKDQFEASDVKQAMKHFMDLLDAGDIESIRKANRLGKKIAFETREGGRLPQALAEYNRNTPEGMLREAQQTINKAVDKKQGKGTAEALDNLFNEISDAYENAANKDEFLKEIQNLLTGDLKEYVPSDVAKKMDSKQIKGANKIIDMIDKAESLEDVPFDEIIDAMYKANGGVPFSAKSQYEIYNLLKEASQYEPKSYERRVIEAKAARRVMSEVPSGLGDYIRTFLYDNMLGNFKTAFSRNFLGNVAYQSLEKLREPITAGVDKLASLKTGKRSALGWNPEKAAAYGQGFRKGFAEQGADTFKNHVNTARSGENSFANALKNNKTVHNDNTPLGHFANQVDLYVEQAMKFGDRPIFEANYSEFKTELEQMISKYGKNNVAGLENIKDDDLPEVIDKIAAVRAADEVFQKQGEMSEGLTKLRDGLGDISKGALGVDLLSTASAPFTLTPGNMLERAIEYTPLGFGKNAIQTAIEANKGTFDQRRFAEQAGRSLLGLPVLYGAYKGAQKGRINGGYSTDPDEKAAQYEDGFIEYGFNIPKVVPYYGGKTLDTSDLPVYGPFMQAGSVLAENGMSPEASLQAAEAVAGGSAMQGIRRAFGADSGSYSSQNGVVENLLNTVKSSGSQFVPSLVRQTAQTTDPYKRDLGEYGTDEYYKNLVKNSIPVLRQTMPIKTSVEGEAVLQNQGRSLPEKILENYVLPMNVSEYNPSPLNQEASKLLDETGSAIGFAPKALRRNLRDWDAKANMDYSEEQFRNYKQDLGQLNSVMGHAFINSDFYQSMPDEDKADYLSKAYAAMKNVARLNATGIDTDDKIANAYLEAGGGDKGIDAAIDYMQQKYVFNKYDVSSSNGSKAVYEDLGEQGIEQFAELKEALDGSTSAEDIKDVLDRSGLSASDKAKYYSYLAPSSSPGANPYGNVAGASYKPEKDKSYQKALEYIPTLKPADYYQAKQSIDADNNNSIKQQELVDYMNSYGVAEDEGLNYWSAYGQSNWKKKPKYVNGTWVLP